MKNLLFAVAALAGLSVLADGAPTATVTSFAQDADGRTVRIGYTLANAPAIVTMTVEHKDGDTWTALDGAALRNVTGAFNRILREDGAYSVSWRPDKSWPDRACAAGDLRVTLKAWALDDPPDYAVFSATVTNSATFFESEAQLPYPVSDPLYRSEFLLLRRIPVGSASWQVGSLPTETGRADDREHPHTVKFAHDYYMGVFEFTRNQYDFIVAHNWGNDGKCEPANNLTWVDFRGSGTDYDWPTKKHDVAPTSILGKVRALTGQDFDLPTEAQWEVACRAGTTTGLYNGKECRDSSIDDLVWHKTNSGGKRQLVGLKQPNGWGLYDMIGNVSEWCLDWMTKDRSGDDGATDPTGPAGPDSSLGRDDFRALRGGSVGETDAVNHRSGRRGWDSDVGVTSHVDAGGRLCLTLPLK